MSGEMQVLCVVLLCLSWFVAPLARAQDCSLATTDVAFGAYDPVSASPTDGLGEVRVTCWFDQVPVTIALSGGNSGNPANRYMTSGTTQLPYNLYTNAARNIVFPNANAGPTAVQCTTGVNSTGCTGSVVLFVFTRAARTVYGRIPPGANVGVGAYGDAVSVRVTF
jgi:spore coat protein U-like protein